KSRLTRYNEERIAYIDLSAELNFCEKSFAAAKEMAHLIFDSPEISCVKTSGDAIRMIEGLLSESLFGENITGSVEGAVTSEKLMILGAAELFFPVEVAIDYAQRVADGKLTNFHVAHIFKIPVQMVERLTQPKVLEAWS